MTRLLGFVRDIYHPYIIQAPGIKLHNIITKQRAYDDVAVRLLHIQANGDQLVREFRKERFGEDKKTLYHHIKKKPAAIGLQTTY